MYVLLNFLLLSAGNLGSSPPHACYPTPVLLGILPLRGRIEDTSHGSITATRCTFTTTSHFLFTVSGSVSDQLGAGGIDETASRLSCFESAVRIEEQSVMASCTTHYQQATCRPDERRPAPASGCRRSSSI